MSYPSDATKKFAEWLNAGPALAKAAGCHVGIKVTTAKAKDFESGAHMRAADLHPALCTEASPTRKTITTEGKSNV